VWSENAEWNTMHGAGDDERTLPNARRLFNGAANA
jgi:hypothetical protein